MIMFKKIIILLATDLFLDLNNIFVVILTFSHQHCFPFRVMDVLGESHLLTPSLPESNLYGSIFTWK